MSRIIRALKTVNYRLWAAILLMMFIPIIYQTVRIFFLGDMPGDWGFNIASQLSWVNLFYEVIQEAFILPLFFLLGKSLNNKAELENKIRSGLIVVAVVYLAMSSFLAIFANPLVVFMAQEGTLVDATVTYIRLETVAALFSTLWRFMLIVFVISEKEKYMYIALSIQMVLSILLDTFLLSGLKFSANMGVNGIAITNMITNSVVLCFAGVILYKEDIKLFRRKKLCFKWMKEWVKIGKFSGMESFLRNFAFMIMIIRMVNVVAEQGNYWVANNFIWGWLLLPGLALGELVKREIGVNEKNIREKTFGYICLVSIFAVVWLATIPLWQPFLKNVMNVDEYQTVFYIVLIQTGFYITFLFNSCIFDSTFYGLGKTNYMLIQSVCIDVLYYGIMFILYMTNVFVPTLLGISLMFGIGMVLDFIPTMILYRYLLKKKGIKIDFKLDGNSIKNL